MLQDGNFCSQQHQVLQYTEFRHFSAWSKNHLENSAKFVVYWYILSWICPNSASVLSDTWFCFTLFQQIPINYICTSLVYSLFSAFPNSMFFTFCMKRSLKLSCSASFCSENVQCSAFQHLNYVFKMNDILHLRSSFKYFGFSSLLFCSSKI